MRIIRSDFPVGILPFFYKIVIIFLFIMFLIKCTPSNDSADKGLPMGTHCPNFISIVHPNSDVDFFNPLELSRNDLDFLRDSILKDFFCINRDSVIAWHIQELDVTIEFRTLYERGLCGEIIKDDRMTIYFLDTLFLFNKRHANYNDLSQLWETFYGNQHNSRRLLVLETRTTKKKNMIRLVEKLIDSYYHFLNEQSTMMFQKELCALDSLELSEIKAKYYWNTTVSTLIITPPIPELPDSINDNLQNDLNEFYK